MSLSVSSFTIFSKLLRAVLMWRRPYDTTDSEVLPAYQCHMHVLREWADLLNIKQMCSISNWHGAKECCESSSYIWWSAYALHWTANQVVSAMTHWWHLSQQSLRSISSKILATAIVNCKPIISCLGKHTMIACWEHHFIFEMSMRQQPLFLWEYTSLWAACSASQSEKV